MEIIKAARSDMDAVMRVVRDTINEVYPKYYPQAVVDFFLAHHNWDKVCRDIEHGLGYILRDEGEIRGVGGIEDGNHITRVYVLPKFQRRGYGSAMMDELERIIAAEHNTAVLDSSLPAFGMYLKRGYVPGAYREYITDSGHMLCYHEMEKTLIDSGRLNGRVFTSVSNSSGGEVSGETLFYYHQQGSIIWAEYSGGAVRKGFLTGVSNKSGHLDFYYSHVNERGEPRCGKCRSVPETLPDGRLRFHEDWQWLDAQRTEGRSIIEELCDNTAIK